MSVDGIYLLGFASQEARATSSELIIKPLTEIINQCFSGGYLLNKVKAAKVTPIHKKRFQR